MNKIYPFITLLAICWSTLALAFDSGSTGADGILNITEDTQLQLPPDGIFNYTDITVAAGATLSFIRNANNTPVTLLASGDVTISGTIDVSGQRGGPAAGDPVGGAGGPGGFNGGAGGLLTSSGLSLGQDGQGPGGGVGGAINRNGHSGVFGNGVFDRHGTRNHNIYGNPELLPLIGGSGGGGGSGRDSVRGSGGGGGGGAILIAASGTVTVNGSILADGGEPGVRRSYLGGSGSGGAIRIVTTTLSGEGTISAVGNVSHISRDRNHGRIRLEADNLIRVSRTFPNYSFDRPGRILISNLPTLRVTSIGGIAVPANLTGFRDIILPGITTNPVTVNFATTHVPAGTTITLRVASRRADTVTVSSQPTAADGSATADITLPYGDNSLTAELTLELTASLGRDYSRYAQGEPVQRIRLNVDDKGQSTTTLITESGKEYTIPTTPLAMQ